MGIGLTRRQQILIMVGLFEGVGVLLFLELAGFSAFSTDLDEGGVLSMSLIYIELIPDQQGFSECIIWAPAPRTRSITH